MGWGYVFILKIYLHEGVVFYLPRLFFTLPTSLRAYPSAGCSYKVPRVAFINKLDRQGANPFKVVKDLRTKLKLNAALVQVGFDIAETMNERNAALHWQCVRIHNAAVVGDVR